MRLDLSSRSRRGNKKKRPQGVFPEIPNVTAPKNSTACNNVRLDLSDRARSSG